MENSRIIKSITPVPCPACGKTVYVCQEQLPAVISSVMKEEEVKAAKDLVREELANIKFKNEEDKKTLEMSLDDPSTIFGPEDAKVYIEQIKQAQQNG